MDGMSSTGPVPHGYCECGCGEKTPIATGNVKARGYVKGQPKRFIPGHQYRCRETRPVAERFWEKVDRRRISECWPWTAKASHKYGYGMIATDAQRGPIYAHRLSYELHYGPIPDGLHVLHSCDNPPCVNPTHLFLGTHVDNMEDCARKGRALSPSGEAHRSAKLTEDRVLAIRAASTGRRGEQVELAHRYGVTRMTICQILKRQTWKHI